MEITRSSLYAIAIGFCLFLLLVANRRLNHLSLRFFVFYLGLESVSFVIEWLLLHPEIAYKHFWLGTLMCITLLTAPCLWLFAKESIHKVSPSALSISAKQRWILFSGFVLLLPLMILPLFGHNSELAKTLIKYSVHETMLMAIALYLFQVPFYLKKCIGILNKQTQLNKNTFSNVADMPLAILKALIVVLSGDWIFNILRVLVVMLTDGSSPFYLVLTFAEVALLVWAMYKIISPTISPPVQLETHNKLEDNVNVFSKDGTLPGEKPGKYANYAMDSEALKRIEQKIDKAMSEDQLFKESSLNLAALCEAIGEYPHYVSQVINQNMNKNFYELVNYHRIEAAKRILKTEPRESIINIALNIGYNSKSTFNNAFKKLTGLTPSQFRTAK